jgi:hypothetical protein
MFPLILTRHNLYSRCCYNYTKRCLFYTKFIKITENVKRILINFIEYVDKQQKGGKPSNNRIDLTSMIYRKVEIDFSSSLFADVLSDSKIF